MNLYTWWPKGHGQMTFSVVAESEEDAFAFVSEFIETHYRKDGAYFYEAQGWGTAYYELTVHEAGVVVLHENA